MPKKAIDFSNTVFYKIVCKDLSIKELYVGHTTNFTKRKCSHKTSCNNEKGNGYNLSLYKFIRENEGWENFDMIMIHRQSCIDVYDARAVERGFIETLFATLNFQIPNRTKQEWKELNKDKIKEQSKIYREANKEKITESQLKYSEANKEKIKESSIIYREANKDKIKAKRENDKEYMKEYSIAYREANKENKKKQDALYREANMEEIKKKKALYREANKEKIKERDKLYHAKRKLLKQQTLETII